MRAYDTVVVGGRVAGASTAMLLARAGQRVALLDRGRHGSDALSTHAFMRAGVLQLSRWDLLEPLVAAGTPPVRRTTFHHADRHSVQVTIRPSAGVDALYAPRRSLLDRVLVDAADDAGVDVFHETTVTHVERAPSGRVTGVRAIRPDGRGLTLGARTTVGADGVRSTVARTVGARVERQGRTAGAVLYRYVGGLDGDGYEWAYGSNEGAGLIPTNGGESCVFVATTPERMRSLRREGAESAFTTLLASAAPAFVERVRAGTPTGRLHGWAGVPGFVRRAWGPGWALVGDAGYFKDPITTHGMTDALRDAELLSDALVAGRDGVPEEIALSGYQATRDRLSAALFEVTEEVAAYDWDTPRLEALLRRVSSAMSDEVDHLQALPTRRPPRRQTGPADRALLPG